MHLGLYHGGEHQIYLYLRILIINFENFVLLTAYVCACPYFFSEIGKHALALDTKYTLRGDKKIKGIVKAPIIFLICIYYAMN